MHVLGGMAVCLELHNVGLVHDTLLQMLSLFCVIVVVDVVMPDCRCRYDIRRGHSTFSHFACGADVRLSVFSFAISDNLCVMASLVSDQPLVSTLRPFHFGHCVFVVVALCVVGVGVFCFRSYCCFSISASSIRVR